MTRPRLANQALQAADAKRAAEAERLFAGALRAIAGMPQGRLVLHELIFGHGWCGLKDASFSGRGDETSLREGHRDIGRKLDGYLLETCPRLWASMMAEGQAAQAREQQRRPTDDSTHDEETADGS
jgi:hypothetical protein